MRRILAISCLAVFLAAAPLRSEAAFSVAEFRHRLEGLDRYFVLVVANDSSVRERIGGRLIVLNVYDLGPAETIAIPFTEVPAGGAAKIEVRWEDAPIFGQARVLLVLNGQRSGTVVETYGLWIFPWQAALIVGGALLILAGLVLLVVRRAGAPARRTGAAAGKPAPKKRPKRRRPPSGMVFHVVEEDESVVAVAERYGVSWEDVVRANRLKPPYDLAPGTEILVPKHGLKRPGQAP